MIAKNKYGQYFTMDAVADFMVSLITHKSDDRVVEPSCGEGVFLKFLERYGFSDIAAYEIDKDLAKSYGYVEHISFISVPLSIKYDVVIGNPPYIRWKNLEQELKDELKDNELWKKYFNCLSDYLSIFILKSIEHLTDKGELIFVCSEYWMYTKHSCSLRDYMCGNGYFSDIYMFEETSLFEKVTGSFVVFRYVKSRNRQNWMNLYTYVDGRKSPTIDRLKNGYCFTKQTIPQFQIGSRWVLAAQNIQQELASFESKCVSKKRDLFAQELNCIADFCDIGNGMVSGLDKAFQIDESLNYDDLNEYEKSAIIQVMKAKDLSLYTNNSESKYIFVRRELNDEREFESQYPLLAKHLSAYRDSLEKRYNYNREIPYWEFVFPRNQRLFERQDAKIFVPCKERISNKQYFRFCYAPAGYYPTQDVTAIFKKSNTKESIEYILAFLNSERVFDWIKFNGVKRGEVMEFSKAPIESIPFRAIDWDSPVEVELHNKITAEVSAYLKDRNIDHIKTINVFTNYLLDE